MSLLSTPSRLFAPVQVINGPTYALALSGSGYKPKLNLSFLTYDFGPCHVFQQGMTPAAAKLVVVNEDKLPVSFDTVFDNTDNWQVCWPGHCTPCLTCGNSLSIRCAVLEAEPARHTADSVNRGPNPCCLVQLPFL